MRWGTRLSSGRLVVVYRFMRISALKCLPTNPDGLCPVWGILLNQKMEPVLVPFSRSLYFNDKGQERGVSVDTIRDFERWINKKYAKNLGKRPLTVFIIPTTRDKLL